MRIGPFLPAAAVVGCWILAAYVSGAYFARDWYPLGIGLVVLLAVVAIARERALPSGTAARVTLGLFAGFVAWSYLSMLWAGSAGSAWEASNKLLLYLAAAWVLALLPWDRRSAATLLGAWSIGVTGVCVISLLGAASATELSGFFLEWRLQDPIGYTNGTAALGVMAALPALALCYQREVPAVLQGILIAAAAFLLEFALLAQSRASVASALIVGALLMTLAPERLRLVPRLALVAAAVAASSSAVLDVFSTGESGGPLGPAIDEAAAQMAWTSAVAGVAGGVLGVLEARVRPGPRLAGCIRGGTIAAVALGLAVGAVLVVANSGRAVDYVGDEWRAFTKGEIAPTEGDTRFTIANPYERPDYWRVAVDLFEEAPVAGVGAGGFEREYTARRREPKNSRFPHNIWLRALATTGIIGLGLLIGLVLLAYVSSLRTYRRRSPLERGVVLGCLAVTTYFLLHSTFDWLDEIPAVASPALALPLVAIVVSHSASAHAGRGHSRGLGVRAVFGGTALAAIAVVSLTLPYLSLRFMDRAEARWTSDAEEAFKDLDRAASLNPISNLPPMTEGTIATNLRDATRARRAFADAIDIEDNWYPHMELALLAANEGRFDVAEREIERAGALARRDPFVKEARERIVRREQIDPVAFNRMIRRETLSTFRTRQR